jgi:hypothetical protein
LNIFNKIKKNNNNKYFENKNFYNNEVEKLHTMLFGDKNYKNNKNNKNKEDDFYNLNKLNKKDKKLLLKSNKDDFFISNKLNNEIENKINLVI